MTIEERQSALDADPFRPFVLCLADGRHIPVPRPEFMWAPPTRRRTVWVVDDETDRMIDPMRIVSIDFHARNGNGRGGRGRPGRGRRDRS